MSELQTTKDAFLGEQLMIHQPVSGFRTGQDTVLLAASIDARKGQRVLDVGCGPGTAALCVAKRLPNVFVDGLELQSEIAELAKYNVVENGLDEQVTIMTGSVTTRPPVLRQDSYDHVLANPPYMKAGAAQAAPNASKAISRMEKGSELSDWVNFCLSVVKTKGTITFVYPTERIDELLALFYGRAGEVVIFPLWSRTGLPAKRFLVRARKGIRGPATISPGLVLHGEDRAFTPDAENILKSGAALCLT